MKSNAAFSFCYVTLAILIVSILSIGSPIGRHALASESGPLRIALLPLLDSFPFYVAEAEGYFEKQGVRVKVVPVASGLERDQLMQSGAIDGMLNEMMSSANFNREHVRVKIVSAA